MGEHEIEYPEPEVSHELNRLECFGRQFLKVGLEPEVEIRVKTEPLLQIDLHVFAAGYRRVTRRRIGRPRWHRGSDGPVRLVRPAGDDQQHRDHRQQPQGTSAQPQVLSNSHPLNHASTGNRDLQQPVFR